MENLGKNTDDNHGGQYERLPQEDKELADAILGYLNGCNNKKAERILYAIIEEIGYHSTITT